MEQSAKMLEIVSFLNDIDKRSALYYLDDENNWHMVMYVNGILFDNIVKSATVYADCIFRLYDLL